MRDYLRVEPTEIQNKTRSYTDRLIYSRTHASIKYYR